jgi:shikimate kinase
MRLQLKRTPGIYLVGFMGSGKSTVGRALAEEIGWRFVDLDEEIERRESLSIPEIFDQRGEPEFRALESGMLREFVRAIACGRPHVLSLGGGAFLSEENFTLVSNNGVSVWLDCPLETIERRIAGCANRPLARDPGRLRELYHQRRPGYSRADFHVTVATDDALAIVRHLLELPLF